MDARRESDSTAEKNHTTTERESERELVVTRTFNAPARIVFEAWTKPELLMRWWAPKSFGLSFLSCEAAPRRGFEGDNSESITFFTAVEICEPRNKPISPYALWLNITHHFEIESTANNSYKKDLRAPPMFLR